MNYEKYFFDMYFRVVCNEDTDDKLFVSEDTQKTIDHFYNTYIKPVRESDHNKCDDMYDAFGDVIRAERRQAFEVGFRSAVRLMHDLYGDKQKGGQQ